MNKIIALPKLIVFLAMSIIILIGGRVYSQDKDYQQLLRAKKEKKKSFKPFKLPTLIIGAGIVAFTDNDILSSEEIRDEREYRLKNFHNTLDDYLQFTPIAATYLLGLLNQNSEFKFGRSTQKLIKAEVLMLTTVHILKKTTKIRRPDGSAINSFPSGHTAQAFLAATFLHKEYGHLSRWYSIGGYTVASAVGIMRILNDKHWASDVLVGAGIGILSTNLMYLKNKNSNKKGIKKTHIKEWIVMPGYARKQFNMTLTMKI